jgi:pantoate--beta-alanine ligase
MSNTLNLFQSIKEYRTWRKTVSGRIGFVPTMGALHEGHASLLRAARRQCDYVVLSIFVNSEQFSPGEDFEKYPRNLISECQLAEKEGVDIVFAPNSDMIYPEGFSTYVEETQLSQPLCGKFRPGHFRGVTTIVLKLFNIIQPDIAFFGMKDAQQFFVLEKMVADLGLPIEMKGEPAVREVDGLAMSSRNAYLSNEDREKAPLIYRTLKETAEILKTGESVRGTLKSARKKLEEKGIKLQYLQARRLPDLSLEQTDVLDKNVAYVIALAAFIGKTRLIDNFILEPCS